jgi:hypothetical protein
MGINTGGWGLRLKTEDMAKFGQLYLQEGTWNGKQILPVTWIREATTFQIDQMPGVEQSVRDSSEWLQGYCYQFWRCRNNAYRGDGAFGQYIIVMPEKDAVIAITSETQDMQNEINLVWKHLFAGIKNEKIPENPGSYETLKQMLSSLRLPLKVMDIDSPITSQISGRTYTFDANDRHMESMSFDFTDNICKVSMKSDKTDYSFKFNYGKWAIGETTRPGPNLLSTAQGHFKGLTAVKVAGSYSWQDEQTLELVLRYIESPHTEIITCRFEGDKIYAGIKISFTPQADPVQLTGRMTKE